MLETQDASGDNHVEAGDRHPCRVQMAVSRRFLGMRGAQNISTVGSPSPKCGLKSFL